MNKYYNQNFMRKITTLNIRRDLVAIIQYSFQPRLLYKIKNDGNAFLCLFKKGNVSVKVTTSQEISIYRYLTNMFETNKGIDRFLSL